MAPDIERRGSLPRAAPRAPKRAYDGTVPTSSRRRSVAKAAVDNILHRISALHPCPEAEAARSRAEQHMREVEAWTPSHPTSQEKERLMKRLLKLHVDVANLERDSPRT